jgi:hypothetical protein
MNPRDLEQIGFVTRKFNALQGFRCDVPLGLLFLSLSLQGLIHTMPLLVISLTGLVLVGNVFIQERAKTYYAERFGVVVATRRRPATTFRFSLLGRSGAAPRTQQEDMKSSALWLALLVCVLAPIGVAAWQGGVEGVSGALTHLVDLLGPLMCLAIGVAFLVSWWVEREHRFSQGHIALAGLLCLAFGASSRSLAELPLGMDPLRGAQLVVGACMLVCGLLDHLQLVRILGPSPAMGAEEAR